MDRVWDTHRDGKQGGFFDLPPGFYQGNPYLSEPARLIEATPEASSNAVAV